jgi:hypothetical protein
MRKACCGWVMAEEDAHSMLRLIEERIRASDIRVEHRDVLIRLRAMIEDDLAEAGRCQPEPSRSPLEDRSAAYPDPSVGTGLGRQAGEACSRSRASSACSL